MGLKVILQDVKKLEAEGLIVGFFEDVRPLKGLAGELDWLLCGSLSSLLLENKISGKTGDVALLTPRGKMAVSKIFLVGLGRHDRLSPDSLSAAARAAVLCAAGTGVRAAVVEPFPSSGIDFEKAVAAVRDGVIAGSAGTSMEVTLLAPDTAGYEKMTRIVRA